MEGKVVSYDSSKGLGKILVPKNGVKTFFIENWIDYNILPEVGLEVCFDFDDQTLTNIHTLNNKYDLIEQLNTKISYSLPELAIKENIPLNECLEEYFEIFKKISLKYKDLLQNNKTLPYKKIKRFIFTAYNNLLERDISINDIRLKEIKNSLDEVEYYYDKLKRETKNPLFVILEKLVLSKQQNYLKLKNKFDDNKCLITENTTNANILELKIKTLIEELKDISKKSKLYNEKQTLLKAYRRKYVDLIDDSQNLKEENSAIITDIRQFEQVYATIFEKFFNKDVDILLNILEKEMNVLAYEFDTILWENAKNSTIIQNFFIESKIEGNYSTKTFMKYYLKNLKNDKMNEFDAELLEIFNELTVFSKKIVVFDRNKNRVKDIYTYLLNLDHDNNIQKFDNIKLFISYIKEHKELIDLAVIAVSKDNISIIEKIRFVLEKLNINFILFSDEIKQDKILPINVLYKKLKEAI